LVPKLLALAVAILPTPAVRERAVALSASLPESESHGLRLDHEHLPHITLTQHFIRVEEREQAFDKIDEVLREQPPFRVKITGAGQGSSSVWMVVEPTKEIVALHERLMEALRGLERPGGTKYAFRDPDARMGDVLWVSSYRLKSSFTAYAPHITLGHAAKPPVIDPMSFQASIIGACHLGRFCACREILRSWTLG
jgi:2'-5' RNA ligase